MEFQFSCECGDDLSGFTRGEDTEAGFTIGCEDCGAVYAVTVTQIQPSDGE